MKMKMSETTRRIIEEYRQWWIDAHLSAIEEVFVKKKGEKR